MGKKISCNEWEILEDKIYKAFIDSLADYSLKSSTYLKSIEQIGYLYPNRRMRDEFGFFISWREGLNVIINEHLFSYFVIFLKRNDMYGKYRREFLELIKKYGANRWKIFNVIHPFNYGGVTWMEGDNEIFVRNRWKQLMDCILNVRCLTVAKDVKASILSKI